MRVVSGKYKGRLLKGYNEKTTRPTTDKVKEAVFSMIRPYLNESVCLDLFAGTGSLGIEALSNYASYCYFVEKSISMKKILQENIAQINDESNHEIINDTYGKALNYFSNNNIKFDIVFLDPPYDKNYISDCLVKFDELNLLNDGAIVVCEFDNEKFNNSKYDLLKEKKYGNIKVNVLKKKWGLLFLFEGL